MSESADNRLGKGPRKGSFLTDGLMEMSVRVIEGSSAVQAKQKGKWFGSEVVVAIDDISEDQLHRDGDVWEKATPYRNCSRKRALDLHQTEVQGIMPELILCSSIWQCI